MEPWSSKKLRHSRSAGSIGLLQCRHNDDERLMSEEGRQMDQRALGEPEDGAVEFKETTALSQRWVHWVVAVQAQRWRGAPQGQEQQLAGLPYSKRNSSSGSAVAQGSWLHLLWNFQEGRRFRAIEAPEVQGISSS
jgi:hypothetical protein